MSTFTARPLPAIREHLPSSRPVTRKLVRTYARAIASACDTQRGRLRKGRTNILYIEVVSFIVGRLFLVRVPGCGKCIDSTLAKPPVPILSLVGAESTTTGSVTGFTADERPRIFDVGEGSVVVSWQSLPLFGRLVVRLIPTAIANPSRPSPLAATVMSISKGTCDNWIELGCEAYQVVSKIAQVNKGKKRQYLRQEFVYSFVEKYGLPLTPAQVSNALKALDRRSSKGRPRVDARHSWIQLNGSEKQYHASYLLTLEPASGAWNIFQRSGFDVRISVDRCPSSDNAPRITVACPWQVVKSTMFVCRTPTQRLEESITLDNDNRCCFPRTMLQALLTGEAEEVRQYLNLHFWAADLNRLLHVYFQDHAPIARVTITYTIGPRESGLHQNAYPIHNSSLGYHAAPIPLPSSMPPLDANHPLLTTVISPYLHDYLGRHLDADGFNFSSDHAFMSPSQCSIPSTSSYVPLPLTAASMTGPSYPSPQVFDPEGASAAFGGLLWCTSAEEARTTDGAMGPYLNHPIPIRS
ncbi:hypothetical protein NMY22_g8138 [Coprinellus aureogranulatus]|nr:hypothetical protein NMY22_g8138 [Coprinellus aureogranulatus]